MIDWLAQQILSIERRLRGADDIEDLENRVRAAQQRLREAAITKTMKAVRTRDAGEQFPLDLGAPPTTITCSPCALPTSGALRLYYRHTEAIDAETSPCADDEFLWDFTFVSAVPPGLSWKSGYWVTDCQVQPAYQLRVDETDCEFRHDTWTRVYFGCTTGNVLALHKRRWGPVNAFTDISACTANTAGFQSITHTSWPTFTCSPFSVRGQNTSVLGWDYPGGGTTTLNDYWIYIP
jgi:hypothetical protein